jgi:V/A-type H+-transporting ATPase subunit E
MDGIQRIIERITLEVEAECEQIAAEAQSQCELIRAEYSKTEQEEYWKIVNAGAAQAEQRRERLANVAALESKKRVLATKQELITGVFERASAMISGLPEERYVALLTRLVLEASRTGAETLQFSWRDLHTVANAVCEAANARLVSEGKRGELVVSPATRNIGGGVIVVNGNIETNCAVETLVAQYRNELSGEIADALFN